MASTTYAERIFLADYFFCFSRTNRSLILAWRPLVSRFTVVYALSSFLYWYGFWIGLASEGPTITIAILSLSMFLTPLVCRPLESKNRRTPLWIVISVGILILASVFLIRIDLNFGDLEKTEKIVEKLSKISVFPLACLLLAVVAECISDFTSRNLSLSIDKRWDEFRGEFRFLEGGKAIKELRASGADKEANALFKKSVKSLAGREIILQSLPISFVLSISFLIFHGSWENAKAILEEGIQAYQNTVLLFIAMAFLGLIGSGAKAIFVTPLQHNGLHME